jgi:hypothetical protein
MELGLPWRKAGTWAGVGHLSILGPDRRSVSKMFGGARGTGMLTAVRVQVTRAMLGL